MFITENQNIGDSVLFLLSSRAALANIVEASGPENSKGLISFIHNEASDYEVMHLLLKGSLPTEKYNTVAEMILFSEFKESMLLNHDFVTEMVGQAIFDNVLNEVDSLYMQGSTARPVLEFDMHTDRDLAFAYMISEAAILSEIPAGRESLRGLALLKQKMAGLVGPAKAKALAIYNAAKAKLVAAKAGAVKGAAATKTAAVKAGAAAKGAAVKGGVAAKGAAVKAGAATSKFAATKAGLATGGAAAGALAIYAGAKIYKRFFSQAAKACGGQSGPAKTACMKKYKKQAIMKQASAIQSASGTCAKSKNPGKCKAAVGKKVASLKAKAAGIAA